MQDAVEGYIEELATLMKTDFDNAGILLDFESYEAYEAERQSSARNIEVMLRKLESGEEQLRTGPHWLRKSAEHRRWHQHTSISLGALRRGEELSVARDCLARRGFCWLNLDEEIAALSAPAISVAEAFLAGPGKGTGSRSELRGHVSTKFKDSLRLLTGELVGATTLPSIVAEPLLQLATALDSAQVDLARNLFPHQVQPLSASEFPDVALLSGSPRYGLLDFVRYHMGESTPPEIVGPHADPGLLLLGLPSSVGLEFRDENGLWVAPPPRHAVLWAGQAASFAVPAVHRVVAAGAPRLAIWHELCTRSQIAPPMLDQLRQHGLELTMFGIRGTDAVLQVLREAEDHQRPSHVEARSLPIGLLLSKTLDLDVVPAATYIFGVDASKVRHVGSTARSLSEVVPVSVAIEGPGITLPGIGGLASEGQSMSAANIQHQGANALAAELQRRYWDAFWWSRWWVYFAGSGDAEWRRHHQDIMDGWLAEWRAGLRLQSHADDMEDVATPAGLLTITHPWSPWSTWDKPLNERIEDYLTELVRVVSSFMDAPRLWLQSGGRDVEDVIALLDDMLERYWLALWRLHRLGCILRCTHWWIHLYIKSPQLPGAAATQSAFSTHVWRAHLAEQVRTELAMKVGKNMVPTSVDFQGEHKSTSVQEPVLFVKEYNGEWYMNPDFNRDELLSERDSLPENNILKHFN